MVGSGNDASMASALAFQVIFSPDWQYQNEGPSGMSLKMVVTGMGEGDPQLQPGST